MTTARITTPENGASLRPLPGWIRAEANSDSLFSLGVQVGARLAHLDTFVRCELSFVGLWRQRLALQAAASSLRLLGRPEDVAELRDAWFLRRVQDDAGPVGSILAGWRLLTRTTVPLRADHLSRASDAFDVHIDAVLPEMRVIIHEADKSRGNPIDVAAHTAAAVMHLRPQAELLAYWCADLILAHKLKWPAPLPLLVTALQHPSVRALAPHRKTQPGSPAWHQMAHTAYGIAAIGAIDLGLDLERRSKKLTTIAPKLRAKGAGEVVVHLLSDDALLPSSGIGDMSDRALRRLCDRLIDLGAIRELTHRSTFRLYGL